MLYPTLENVSEASKEQLAYWSRFLPSPGLNHINSPNFRNKLDEELAILNRLLERFNELGGWNPALSKEIGWDLWALNQI